MLQPALPAWLFMWVMAGAIFAGCKVLAMRWPPDFGWLLLWPGMDQGPFLRAALEKSKAMASHRTPKPSAPAGGSAEWFEALGKIGFGAVLVWGVARLAPRPLAAGWIGMIGLIFLMHFGGFHLIALRWRRVGVEVGQNMRNPLAARTLAELWGSRWNRAFSELARRRIFKPLRPRIGPVGATMAVFAFSGIVHELAISVPSRGGYGLPGGYFLLQGAATVFQRAHPWLASGWRGRVFTAVIAAGPAFWLFPPVSVERCFVPFLQVIHAL
jgi:alginate O-acetyltransferase complex protein AlgI